MFALAGLRLFGFMKSPVGRLVMIGAGIFFLISMGFVWLKTHDAGIRRSVSEQVTIRINNDILQRELEIQKIINNVRITEINNINDLNKFIQLKDKQAIAIKKLINNSGSIEEKTFNEIMDMLYKVNKK